MTMMAQLKRGGGALLAASALLMGGCVEYGAPLQTHLVQATVREGNTTLSVTFSDGDRRAIHDYYAAASGPGRGRGHGHNPHGSFDELPPGIRKQIHQGKGLPPGLERHRLPDALEARLSPLPDGYIRLRVGTDFVLMDTRTNLVVDMISPL